MPHSFVLHRKSRWMSVPMKNCLKFGKSKRNTSRKCSNKKSPSSLIGWRGFFVYLQPSLHTTSAKALIVSPAR